MNEANSVRGRYPLQVEKVVFKNGFTISDATIVFCGGFIIVSAPDNGAPTMFNIDEISELRRVKEIHPKAKVEGYTW